MKPTLKDNFTKEIETAKRFLSQKSVSVVFLILFYPIGLVLLWTMSRFDKGIRLAMTLGFGFWFFFVLGAWNSPQQAARLINAAPTTQTVEPSAPSEIPPKASPRGTDATTYEGLYDQAGNYKFRYCSPFELKIAEIVDKEIFRNQSEPEEKAMKRVKDQTGLDSATATGIYQKALSHCDWKSDEQKAELAKMDMAKKQKGPMPLQSAWDSSVPCVEHYLKDNLKDPDSYQGIEWSKIIDMGTHWAVRHKYRAKNSFGGYVIENYVYRLMNPNGNCVVLGAEPYP